MSPSKNGVNVNTRSDCVVLLFCKWESEQCVKDETGFNDKYMDYCKDNRKSAGGAFMICILFMILAAIGAYKWVIYREELSKRNRKRRDENYQMKKNLHKVQVRNRLSHIFENILKQKIRIQRKLWKKRKTKRK